MRSVVGLEEEKEEQCLQVKLLHDEVSASRARCAELQLRLEAADERSALLEAQRDLALAAHRDSAEHARLLAAAFAELQVRWQADVAASRRELAEKTDEFAAQLRALLGDGSTDGPDDLENAQRC